MSGWFSLHNHSRFSAKDALPSVADMVSRAVDLEYPALGLTDHGTVAGIAQLYKQCRKRDLAALPGIETYVQVDTRDRSTHAKFHACIVATTSAGWRNLIGLNNLAMRQHYRGFPLLDFGNLADCGEQGLLDGLWITTGCWFGVVQSALRSPDPTAAHNVVAALVNAFDGRVLVELQHHNILDDTHDDDMQVRLLSGLARHHGLPVVATADSHYLLEDQQRDHDQLKGLVSFADPLEAVFPGDGYWLCSEAEMRTRLEPDVMDQSLHGLAHLMEHYDLRVPQLDQFSIQVPSVVGTADPNAALERRLRSTLIERNLAPRYYARVSYELAVIAGAGFAPYMLLVAALTDWMAESGIYYNARGSASGSLVCWLLGITSMDPLKFDLRFDRFLSGDRLKPPDIDLDVDQERRGEVLEWLDEKFSMRHIAIHNTLGMRSDESGSLLVKWRTKARQEGRSIDVVPPDELAVLHRLSTYKAINSHGVHPAGVVVVSDATALEAIPTQYVASSKTMTTAFDGPDIESMGYVKIDVLGLATLSAVRRALDAAGLVLSDVPFSDPAVYRRIAKGDTVSLFQLGGYAQRKGCMSLKPTSFNDLVAAMALFRPAMKNASQVEHFIARKHGDEPVPIWHPIIASATADTYGIALYQEQVMAVLRELGMTADELTNTLKAIKASNANIGAAGTHMRNITGLVEKLAADAAFSDTDIDWVLDALAGYAEYGFNKAHAVAYARLAFVTAWLATHHPVAWWAGELSTCQPTETKDVLRAVRKAKVKILPAHINHSSMTWTAELDRNGVRRGLNAIDGLGDKAAAEIAANAPYQSITDLVTRTSSRVVTGGVAWMKTKDLSRVNGKIAALAAAGALHEIPKENP